LAVTLTVTANPAAAATFNTLVSIDHDGTPAFVNWKSPPDLFTPSGVCPPALGELRDPGDDCDAHNQIVRTLDETVFKIEYAVALAAGETQTQPLQLVVTVAGGALIQEGWGGPTNVQCPNGGSVSIDRTVLTCDIGTIGNSPTVAIFMPVVAPMSMKDGDQFGITSKMTEQNNPVEATDTSPNVTVSAGPRFDILKESIAVSDNAPDPTGTGLGPGFLQWWAIGVRGGALDGRGLSQLQGTLRLNDLVEAVNPTTSTNIPMYFDHCADTDTFAGWPDVVPASTANLSDPESQLRAATVSCNQSGPNANITIDVSGIDWSRAANPPTFSGVLTGGTKSALPAGRTGLVAYFALFTWTSTADVDAADANPADKKGTVRACNNVETSAGGPLTGPAITSTWHPVDISRLPNLGGEPDPVANNGDCDTRSFAPPVGFVAGFHAKFPQSPSVDGTGVLPTDTTQSRLRFLNNGPQSQYPKGAILCDKWDNARFGPSGASGATFLTSTGTYTGMVTIEYGTGDWGAASTAGTSDSVKWNRQATSDCSDLTLLPSTAWSPPQVVDLSTTSSPPIPASVPNIDAVNMVRITIDTIPVGEVVDFFTTWHMRPGVAFGDELRNYSAAFVPHIGAWRKSTCAGPPLPAPPCSAGLRLGDSAGLTSHWWTVIGGTVQVEKTLLDPNTTYGAGSTATWKIQLGARAFTGSTTTGGVTHGVKLRDLLPAGLSYVPGSTVVSLGSLTPSEPALSGGGSILDWDVGDLPWLPAGSFNLELTFQTTVSPFATTGSFPNEAQGSTPDYPNPYGPDPGEIRISIATVKLGASNVAAIDKSVTPIVPKPGDTATFVLRYGNPASTAVTSMEAIDLLPFDNDPRGSHFGPGTFTLSGLTTPIGLDAWISTEAPASLDALTPGADGFVDPIDVDPVSTLPSAQWPCKVQDVLAATCVDGTLLPVTLDRVTAVRFVGSGTTGNPFLPAGAGPFSITMTFKVGLGAASGDAFVNSWLARFAGLSLPVRFTAQASTIAIGGPGMSVAKEVRNAAGAWGESAQIPPGGDAEWRITVTNTGGATLHDFTFADPAFRGCASAGLIAAPASLEPGRSFTFTCTEPGITQGYINTVTVAAVDPGGSKVDATDDARVDVVSAPRPIVTVTGGMLAVTGLDLNGILQQGLAALVLGMAVVEASRRRRHHAEPDSLQI
jgi:hypothetical protein